MVLSGRRFLHKVNMAVRGPMEIINKDEASPCESNKKAYHLYTEMIYVSFSTIYTAWQNQDKNLAFCVRSSYYFFFSMLYSLNIKLTRFWMVSQMLDLVQGLQSLSCQVMKTSDSVSVVVKKKMA